MRWLFYRAPAFPEKERVQMWRNRYERLILLLLCAMPLVLWGGLFYANYIKASICAFGPIDEHLAHLRGVFVRYIATGIAILSGFLYVALRPYFEIARSKRQDADTYSSGRKRRGKVSDRGREEARR